MKVVLTVLCVAAACSSSPSKPKPDAAPDAPGFPAYMPAPPQIGHMGATAKVIASPTIVAVYFSGDTQQTALDSFMTAYAASPEWSALSEYGVGAATVATSITLTDTPPGTAAETDIATFMQGKLDGTHAEFGAVDATTLASKFFVLFYPASTTLTLNGQNVCGGISGYHLDTMLTSGARVNYAVVPRCSSPIDVLTAGTSYAMAAVATDPLMGGAPQGWNGYDMAHVAWGTFGGEVSASTCTAATVGGHSAAAIWSNTAAAAFHDPCVPGHEPYFNAAPVLSDTIPNAGTGVIVPVGGTKTIDVQLFSDAAAPAWTVSATSFGGSAPTMQLDATLGQNGDVMHLTLTGTTATQGIGVISSKAAGVTHTWLYPFKVQ